MLNYFYEKKVTTIMIFSSMVLFGIIGLFKIDTRLLPQIETPVLTVITKYPNASAEEVRSLISIPVENAVSTAEGMRDIESVSDNELSVVKLKFDWGEKLSTKVIQVRQKLDSIRNILPQNAEKPVLLQFDPARKPAAIVSVVARDKNFEDFRYFVEKNVKTQLERIEGISYAELRGGDRKEVQVVLDPVKLANFGGNLDSVASAISSSNADVSAGTVIHNEKEYSVRFLGKYDSIQEIEDTVINVSESGTPVFLREVANVLSGTEKKQGEVLVNGQEAIVLNLYQESGYNTIRAVNNLRTVLPRLNEELQGRVLLNIEFDNSEKIRDALFSVMQNLVLGAVLAFLVLYFFLKRLTPAFIIFLSIPVSVISTVFFLWISGVSINTISLAGMAIAIGLLVDNSIIVLESIDLFVRENPQKSIYENVTGAVSSIEKSVISSTLTTVIVFVPIIFLEGMTAEIFYELALTIIYALLISLFTALALTPVLFMFFSGKRKSSVEKDNGKKGTADSLVQGLLRLYSVFFNRFIQSRLLLIVSILFVFASAFGIMFWIDKSIFPDSRTKEYYGEIILPEGTPLVKSIEYAKAFASQLNAKKSITIVGKDPENLLDLTKGEIFSNYIRIFLTLKREYTSEKFSRILQEYISSDKIQYSFNQIATPIQEILGKENNIIRLEYLNSEKITPQYSKLVSEITKDKRILSTDSNLSPTGSQVVFHPDKSKASSLGYSSSQLAYLIQSGLDGHEVTMFKKNDREIPVRVYYTGGNKKSIESLIHTQIKREEEGFSFLNQLVNYKEENLPDRFLRKNSHDLSYLDIEFEQGKKNGVVNNLKKIHDQIGIKESQYMISSQNQEMEDSFRQIGFAFLLSMIFIYMLLASVFDSYIHPLGVAVSSLYIIPGIFLGLYLTGESLSIVSSLGIVTLLGVLVNNSIILFEHIGNSEKTDLKEKVREAVMTRLRPILLTIFTTVGSVLPMFVLRGAGSEFQSPLAGVIFFGLILGTVMTMLFYPQIFLTIEKIRKTSK